MRLTVRSMAGSRSVNPCIFRCTRLTGPKVHGRTTQCPRAQASSQAKPTKKQRNHHSAQAQSRRGTSCLLAADVRCVRAIDVHHQADIHHPHAGTRMQQNAVGRTNVKVLGGVSNLKIVQPLYRIVVTAVGVVFVVVKIAIPSCRFPRLFMLLRLCVFCGNTTDIVAVVAGKWALVAVVGRRSRRVGMFCAFRRRL